MDPQTQIEIEKILEDAKPLLLDLSEKILIIVAQKYGGINSPAATEIARALIHGLVTGLEIEILHSKDTVNESSE